MHKQRTVRSKQEPAQSAQNANQAAQTKAPAGQGARPGALTPAGVLQIQRMFGNKASMQFLKSAQAGAAPIQRFHVYRSGSKTDGNMTPKAKDLEGDKKGLSTFEDLTKTPIRISKAQVIDTDKLTTLSAVRNGVGDRDSHVSIRPEGDDALMEEWSKSQHDSDKDAVKYRHDLTKEVQDAIVSEYKK